MRGGRSGLGSEGEKLKDYSRCPSWNFTDRISLPVLTVHIALLGKAALRK